MSDIPEIRMHERCATCAFRAGSFANQDEITQHKVRLCIGTGTPFLCHEADREAWCAGAADVVMALHEKDRLMAEPEWKQKMMLGLLDAIDKCEDVDKAGGTLTDEMVETFVRNAVIEAIK